MSTTEGYDRILEELAAGEMPDLERKIFDLIRTNPEGLTRCDLIEKIYGVGFRRNAERLGLNKSSEDRKIREAIAQLRNNGIPVISSSGASGYRLDANVQAVSAMVSEWESRVNKLQERIRKVVIFCDIQPEHVKLQREPFKRRY